MNRNYFPHEYNAKDDPKCERLIFEMGMEGYGIFWGLLETLRAQPDYTYPVENIPMVAYKYRTDASKVRRVVFDFGLFCIVEDKIFFSNGLTRRMQPMDKALNTARESGKRGAAKRWGNMVENRDPNGDPINTPNGDPYSNKNRIDKNRHIKKLSNESKESAVKPRTGASKRRAFVAPTLEEFKEYFQSIGGTATEAEYSFDYYMSNGWTVGRACAPMKDWRSAVRNWNKRSKGSRYASNTPNAAPENTSATYQILTMENCQD